MTLTDDEQNYFTVVFKGSLKNFVGNPMRAKTAFGVPVAIGYGDAFAKNDKLEAALQEISNMDGYKDLCDARNVADRVI